MLSMPVIPVLGRWRQEDCNFEASWATARPCFKKIKKEKRKFKKI
jgi:hypothetical protein